MSKRVKLGEIDPNDPLFSSDDSPVTVDMSVQEFSKDYNDIEDLNEVNTKLINYFEKIIRKSYEYKQYVNYLKSDLDITSCAITPSLDIRDFDISLEFHHYPITLYDIVDIICREKFDKLKDGEKVNMFDVMEEVMRQHYLGNIGLVPLSKTAHEMAHNDSLKIPIESVYGNYERFTQEHRKYMRPELYEKVQHAKLIDKKMASEENYKLEKNILNYNVKYNENKDEK